MSTDYNETLDPRLKYVAPWLVTGQVIVLTVMPLLLVTVAVFALWQYWGLDPIWLAPFARGIAVSIEWSVGTFVAVLLGFYAISIGGQLLAVKELSTTRNVLGRVATVVAACALLEWVFVIADAVLNEEGSWGVVAALAVVVAIILFLAMHIGFRMNFDRREEIGWAVERMAAINSNVARLEARGFFADSSASTVAIVRSRARRIALLNGAVILVTSLGVAVFGGALWTWSSLWLALLFGVLALAIVFVGLGYGASTEREVGVGRFERYAMPALVVGTFLAAATITVTLAVGAPDPENWVLGGLATAVGLATLTSCWPLTLTPEPLRRSTVHCAAATLARAHLDGDVQKQKDRIRQLERELDALADQDLHPNGVSVTGVIDGAKRSRTGPLAHIARLLDARSRRGANTSPGLARSR